MTDRPILFSAPMVRAILDGRKTQTRRAVKPQPSTVDDAGRWYRMKSGGESLMTSAYPCPYGAPGDQLWVREGFAVQPELWADNHGPQPIHYTADQVIGFAGKPDQRQIEDYRSKPSIHMPRWASRITLRITDIRVERLQDIKGQHPSESDAIAEGVRAIHHGDGECYYSAFRDEPHPKNWCDPADALHELWNKINGPGAWDANPWVWVVCFERVKP